MPDSFSKKKRSLIMKAVKSRGNKSTEIKFIGVLRKRGIKGWRRNYPLYGSPDFVFPNGKIAVFTDGCFWHGCPYHCRMPHSNRAYWNAKIKRNKQRDKEVNKWYKKNQWTLLRFWEHSIKNDIESCIKKIARSIKNN